MAAAGSQPASPTQHAQARFPCTLSARSPSHGPGLQERSRAAWLVTPGDVSAHSPWMYPRISIAGRMTCSRAVAPGLQAHCVCAIAVAARRWTKHSSSCRRPGGFGDMHTGLRDHTQLLACGAARETMRAARQGAQGGRPERHDVAGVTRGHPGVGRRHLPTSRDTSASSDVPRMRGGATAGPRGGGGEQHVLGAGCSTNRAAMPIKPFPRDAPSPNQASPPPDIRPISRGMLSGYTAASASR